MKLSSVNMDECLTKYVLALALEELGRPMAVSRLELEGALSSDLVLRWEPRFDTDGLVFWSVRKKSRAPGAD